MCPSAASITVKRLFELILTDSLSPVNTAFSLPLSVPAVYDKRKIARFSYILSNPTCGIYLYYKELALLIWYA
jgi:hypothetical protein